MGLYIYTFYKWVYVCTSHWYLGRLKERIYSPIQREWWISTRIMVVARWPVISLLVVNSSSDLTIYCSPIYPLVNYTKSYWKWPFSSWIYPLKMVMFNSYVKLPEGISQPTPVDFHDPPTSAESPHLQASPVGRRSLGTDPRSRRSSATGCCPWLHSADEMCLRCWENLGELQDFHTIFLIFL